MDFKHIYTGESFGRSCFTYPGLYLNQVQQAHNNSHFVEVGAWKGTSASFMAVEIIRSEKKIQFDVIDTWLGCPDMSDDICVKNGTLYETFLHNIEPIKEYINPIRTTSLEGSLLYKDKSLDFVFIDASHDYESVKADVTAWLPKIKEGGTLAGHDIGHTPVQTAVEELLDGYQITEGCWVHRIL